MERCLPPSVTKQPRSCSTERWMHLAAALPTWIPSQLLSWLCATSSTSKPFRLDNGTMLASRLPSNASSRRLVRPAACTKIQFRVVFVTLIARDCYGKVRQQQQPGNKLSNAVLCPMFDH